MKFARMLLAAVAFFAAAGYPALASSQQYDQQSTQQTEQQPDQSVDSQAGGAVNDQPPPPVRPARNPHNHLQNRVIERPPIRSPSLRYASAGESAACRPNIIRINVPPVKRWMNISTTRLGAPP